MLTAGEAGLRGAPDTEYLLRSRVAGRVVVTFDSDFVQLHFQHHPHAGIVYFPHSSSSIGNIVGSLVLIFESLQATEMERHLEFM